MYKWTIGKYPTYILISKSIIKIDVSKNINLKVD